MRTRVITMAVAAMAAVSLTACGGGTTGASDAPVTTMTFSTWQGEEAGYKDFWAAAKAEFEKKNPGVTLEIQQTAYADYQQMLTTRLGANQAPDIIQLPSRFFPVFASQGFLGSLDNEIKASDVPASWPAAQDLMKFDDKYYGVLVQNYGYVMYYDEAALAAANIAVPTTWDDFLAAAKALTKDGKFGVAMDTKQDPNIVLELSWPAVGTGVPYIKDGAYNLTSPEMVKLANQVRELAKYAPQGVASEQKRQYFIDGKAALMFDGPFVGALLDKAPADRKAVMKVAPMPFPSAPGGLSSSVHIPASATGAKKDLAWKFIEMISSPAMQDQFVKLVGTPAPRKGSGADAAASNPRIGVFQTTLANALDVIPDEVRLDYSTFTNEVGNAVSALISTDTPTEQILSDLQASLKSKIPLKSK